jgi:hypothetical protein
MDSEPRMLLKTIVAIRGPSSPGGSLAGSAVFARGRSACRVIRGRSRGSGSEAPTMRPYA